MKPFFSIVVPVFNTEKYLAECINSILIQKYDDYEILLVDDGSTDSSAQICNEYATEYPNKIRCVHKENEGLLMTRLRGYEEAKGDYILNLDSDDKFREDTLFIIASTIEDTGADLILFQASVDEEYRLIWKNSDLNLEQGVVLDSSVLKRLICTDASINNMAFKCARKNLFSDIQNLRRFIGMNNEEDLIQSVQIIDKAKRPVYIAEMLYYYRQTNASSISNNFNPNILQSIKNSAQSVEEYGKKWEEQCPGIMEMVYGRQIKSCAALIRYYFERANSREEIIDFLDNLRKDIFFQKSYENGSIAKLSAIEKANLFNVYHRKYGLVFLTMNLRALLKKNKYNYQRNRDEGTYASK